MVSPRATPHTGPAPPAWGALLDAASDLLALVSADGLLLWANAGFARASGHDRLAVVGQPVLTLLQLGDEVATALAGSQGLQALPVSWGAADGSARTGELNLMVLPLPPAGAGDDPLARARWQLALRDTTSERTLAARADHLAELLDTAQDFGRLGIWERHLPHGPGHWDRHMYRFFGLDPAEGVPPFEEIQRRIHLDDRPAHRYRPASQPAGRYASRYRIALPGQPHRHMHAQWEIRNGPDGQPALVTGIMVDDTEVYELAESFNNASEQLRMAVELGNIAIWRHDLRTNRFFYNDRAFEVVGITPRPEGLPADEVRALIHPDDLPQVLASASAALESDRPFDMEARYRRVDGSWRYVLTRRMLRRDEHGHPLEFVGVALDVSEQVEKTRHATELAKRLEIAASAAGLGIWSRDPSAGGAEWNAQMYRIVGRDPARGLPSRREWMEKIVHPDDRATMRRAHAELIGADGATVEHQYRIVCPDGTHRWLVNRARHELRDGRSLLFGITMDITDRVETEAALRQANERVALATHGAGIGTWERDVRTDTIVWDAQMYLLRGLDPAAGGNADVMRIDLCHPDDLDRVRNANADSVRDGVLCTYEFRVRMPDGSYRWLASRSVPEYDTHGEPLRQLGVNWDIHERVTAEAERQERLIAQRESAAKSQFLARMSHELRTPLNAVLGFAQLLQLGTGLGNEQREKLSHIHSAGRHLLSLINDVLDLSSLAQGQLKLTLQAVPMADVLGEALPLVEALAGRNGVAVTLGPVPGVAWGDRTRIRQVAINLLSNAIKYNRPGGSVTVTAPVHDTFVELVVQDTGRGMSPRQLGQLFEPFNRLGVETEGIEGTGIGLAVVKGLVERMAGSIAVDSEPGQGSRFTVRLPRFADVPAAWPGTTPSDHAPLDGHVRTGQVLYIEDNPINQLLVEELVRSHAGLAIESVSNGLDGVARAAALRPDLILLDIQLPDIDGFEVLTRLRAQPETAGTPCVALSANAMPEDIARARAAGFTDYWTKPIVFNTFLAGLDRLLPHGR